MAKLPIGLNHFLGRIQESTGVVISPEEYDRIYSQRFMESVAKGIADGDAGRIVSTEELERQLTERRKARK